MHLTINHQAPGVCLGDPPAWPRSQLWTTSNPYQDPWIMSQQAQQGDNTAQSNSFYTSGQFPPPAMAGQYSYPPPDGQGNSPPGSTMALPPLSLPPIRSIDGIAQPQQPRGQHGPPAPMGSPMPPAMGQYYPQSQPFPPTSDPNAPQRWPLPPDVRVMSGGRHKKEIKRRTKTGCLTCRKRRIKVRRQRPWSAHDPRATREFAPDKL